MIITVATVEDRVMTWGFGVTKVWSVLPWWNFRAALA